MAKTKKLKLTKAESKLIDELSEVLESRGFSQHEFSWVGNRDINYVSVILTSDKKLWVRVVYGSIKEGWEEFILPLETESANKIVKYL